jgi:hypothetical protein
MVTVVGLGGGARWWCLARGLWAVVVCVLADVPEVVGCETTGGVEVVDVLVPPPSTTPTT